MNFDDKFLHAEISSLVLQAYYKVFNQIGFGFEQSVYQNAMKIELKNIGCEFEANKIITLIFDNQAVGEFEVAFYWTRKIIVQLTNKPRLDEIDLEILTRQLKHSDAEVALLLNFGLVPEHKRRLKN